jgi:hypothetical protein
VDTGSESAPISSELLRESDRIDGDKISVGVRVEKGGTPGHRSGVRRAGNQYPPTDGGGSVPQARSSESQSDMRIAGMIFHKIKPLGDLKLFVLCRGSKIEPPRSEISVLAAAALPAALRFDSYRQRFMVKCICLY